MGSLGQPQADTLADSYNHGAGFVDQSSLQKPLRTFLFGYPLAHTLAPKLHASLFDGISLPWTYSVHETQDASEFLPALKQPDIIGCAVTMPYKVKMMSEVDEVTDEGRIIGAINTVFLRKGADGSTRYIGTNTDTIGVREAFLQNTPKVCANAVGKPAMVIGAGGACRASIHALLEGLGASRVYLVNRYAHEVVDIIESFKSTGLKGEILHVETVEQAAKLETPALIVGCVPDFAPKEQCEITAREVATHFLSRPEKGAVLEMCYHPNPRTTFYELAEKDGWQMVLGTEAMIWQGVAQQILWAELPLSSFKVDEAKRIISKALVDQSHK
jgi:quinate dehydrogenase